MTQCERKKCGEYNMLRCAREAGHAGECSFVVDRENDYPWNKLPKERECCGTFPRTPHRSTCAKYRGKAKPSNVELELGEQNETRKRRTEEVSQANEIPT